MDAWRDERTDALTDGRYAVLPRVINSRLIIDVQTDRQTHGGSGSSLVLGVPAVRHNHPYT